MPARIVQKVCFVCGVQKFMRDYERICAACTKLYIVNAIGMLVRKSETYRTFGKEKKHGKQPRGFSISGRTNVVHPKKEKGQKGDAASHRSSNLAECVSRSDRNEPNHDRPDS